MYELSFGGEIVKHVGMIVHFILSFPLDANGTQSMKSCDQQFMKWEPETGNKTGTESDVY